MDRAPLALMTAGETRGGGNAHTVSQRYFTFIGHPSFMSNRLVRSKNAFGVFILFLSLF
jgi:hypothetical protein